MIELLTGREIEEYIRQYREFMAWEGLPDDSGSQSIKTIVNYVKMWVT